MLTQSETGLGSSDYATVQSQETFPAFKLIAHKANLVFDSSGTLPRSPFMAWDGSDYIFTVEPSYAVGSTEFYDTILVYRYSISARTNTLVQTLSLGFAVSIVLTNPAIAFYSGSVLVYSTRLSGGQQKLTRWKLSSNGSVISATTDGGALSDHTITIPYFDILLYQTKMHLMDSTVPAYPTFTVSTTVAGGHTIDMAFDGLSATYFGFNALTGSIQFDVIHGHGSNVAGITKYAITADATTTNTPRTWTLDRWNGSSWVVCDTQTNITWTIGERKEFVCASGPAYDRVRINVTAANGANPRFREIELFAQEALNPNAFSGVLTGIGPVAAYKDMVYYSYLASALLGWKIYGTEFFSALGANRTSDVYGYFPYRPTSMAMVTTDDPYEDYITITTPYSGSVQLEASGADVTKHFQANSSLQGFFTSSRPFSYDEYGISNGGIYGDILIDSLPGTLTTSRFSNVRLTYSNGLFLLTVGVQRANGKGDGIYLYMSKDGENWSAPQYINSGYSTRMAMIAVGDQIISNRGIAYSTILLGFSPSSQQEDITDYVDEGYSLMFDPVAQASFPLDNSDGHFTSHAFINKDNLVVLEHFVGYRPLTNGNPTPSATPIFVACGKTILETFGRSVGLPEYMIQVSSRDFLSLMTDYIKPLEPKYFESQYIGFDGFDDVTDTNYGGLAHSAVQGGVGTWTTSGGELIYTPAAAGRANSLMFNTQIQPIGQGAVEIVASGGSSAAYGIAFLALDKDNYLAVISNQTGDDVSLIEVRNGASRTIVSGTQDDPATLYVSFDRLIIKGLSGTSTPDEYGGVVTTSIGNLGAIPRDTHPFSQFERYDHPIELTPLCFGYVGIVAS